MRAVVLAAGEGSRMWPLADNRPKHILPVAGKPIISYLLEALAENSIKDVFVVVGFRGELIRSALGDGSLYGLHIEYLDQPKWSGTASAIEVTHHAIGREPFLAVYGDLWVTPSGLQAVIEKANDFPRVMGVVRKTTPAEYGVVDVAGDRLSRIREKPQGVHLPESWVNTGIYVLDEEVFRVIGKTGVSKRSEYELTTSLQRLISEGTEIRVAIIAREDWIDVGRPWDLLDVNERVLASLPHRVNGIVEQGAVLKGPIWLEKEAVIKSGSFVEGPAYIGRSSRIGPNGRIRPFSSIGEGVVIGTSCEIKSSIVMNGTKIPHLSYVGDSIVGEDCNLGAGTITGNLRLDEETIKMRVKGRLLSTGRKKVGVIMGDEAQTAINVSLMPGVRIGSGAWIGPGTVLFNDVPSGHAVFAHQRIVRKRMKEHKVSEKGSTKRKR